MGIPQGGGLRSKPHLRGEEVWEEALYEGEDEHVPDGREGNEEDNHDGDDGDQVLGDATQDVHLQKRGWGGKR